MLTLASYVAYANKNVIYCELSTVTISWQGHGFYKYPTLDRAKAAFPSASCLYAKLS